MLELRGAGGLLELLCLVSLSVSLPLSSDCDGIGVVFRPNILEKTFRESDTSARVLEDEVAP